MKRLAAAAFLIAAVCVAVGCGGKKTARAGHGGAESAGAAVAVPTPDTTPIEALRTPAGLSLKASGATPVPSPSAAPTPAASPKAGS